MPNHSCLFRCLLAVWLLQSADAVMGKGKPTNEPPRQVPINYDVTWLNGIGQFEQVRLRDVAPDGSTVTGAGLLEGNWHAITMDLESGAVTDLNDVIAGLDPTMLPSNWDSSWRLSWAWRINDAGEIAGYLHNEQGGRQIYTYDPNASAPLNLFGVPDAYPNLIDMTTSGEVLYSQSVALDVWSHHILTSNAQIIDIDADLRGAQAMNDSRTIVGNSERNYDTAYVYDVTTDTLTSIPPYFQASDINNAGTIGGGGALTGKGNPQVEALHYSLADSKWLLDENDSNSRVYVINESGQSSGRINPKDRRIPNTSFIYDTENGFWSLNDLINDTAEDTSLWLVSNADGVIAMSEPLGNGFPSLIGTKSIPGSELPSGEDTTLSFILTPFSAVSATASSVPEPTNLALLMTALIALGHWRRNEV